MMQKFRSKPVEIEAWQLVEQPGGQYGGPGVDHDYPPFVLMPEGLPLSSNGIDWLLWVEKSQANATIQPGDWVIREPDGVGFYPCTAEVFAARYEPA